MDNEIQTRKKDVKNPFNEMGFIKLWIISIVFWFSLLISLAFLLSAHVNQLGVRRQRSKQLVKALVHDFLQTLFLLLVVMCVVLYAVYYFISNLF